MDEENKSPANVPEKVKEINANSASVASDDNPVAQNGNSSSGLCGSHNEINNISEHMGSEGPSSDLLNKVAASLKTVDLAENVSDHKGYIFLILLTCLNFLLSELWNVSV